MARSRNRKPREKNIPLARAQRQALIPAEKLLWKALRNFALDGFKFRRQRPIGPFAVDFACVEAKLVIELDGESHLDSRAKDEKRTQIIEEKGWLVLRFWNTQLYDEFKAVKEMIYRTCLQRTTESNPPSSPAPLPPPIPVLHGTSGTRRGERGEDDPPSPPAPLPPPVEFLHATSRIRRRERGDRLATVLLVILFILAAPFVHAQTPSYSKDIRPFLAKYCVECHNAKALKGTLNLDSYKAMMDGSDSGAVVKAGKPDESKLVTLAEHKDKPTMPPPKAKFQPTKDEVKLLRAWVLAGAKDDGVSVKVELPVIKAKADVLQPVRAIAYLAERDSFLVSCGSRVAEYRDFKFYRYLWPNRDAECVSCLAVSPNDQRVAIGSSLPGKRSWTESISLHANGSMGSTGSGVVHKDSIADVACHPKVSLIATAGYDGQVNIVGPYVAVKHSLKEHSDAVFGVAFNPDGSLLASVSADRAMKVWDVANGKLLYTLGEANDWLYAVAWSSDGKYLVSGGVDKSIRVYEANATGAKLKHSVFAHEGPVQKLVFTANSNTLYSVGQDRVIKAWDPERMVEKKVYDKLPDSVLCMILREDIERIVVGRYDGVIQFIDMHSGKTTREIRNEDNSKEKNKLPKPRDERSDSRGLVPNFTILQGKPGKLGPLVSADNPGRSPATAQQVEVPVQIAGTLDRAGLIHYFQFDIKEDGQPFGMRVQTKEIDSKLEPVLVITDMTGRTLAESYDGHLGHVFAKKGRYAVAVRDRDFRGGADFKYRLHLGEVKVVQEIFPMGAQRGTKAKLHINGVFLPSPEHELDIAKDAKPGELVSVPIGQGVLGKSQIVVGEFPEVVTVGKLPVPGTANGRIQKDNQQDTWTFAAKKGQRLIVEVNARRLGSRLDSIIEILDAKGQPVPRAVLRSQAKTHVTFRDHDSAQGNIRIEAWSELNPNDYLFVGNELMKIQALPTHPDADCNFFQAQGQRIGYLDTTPTHHANGTPMYKVTMHSPGTNFPPNGFPTFMLNYKNDDGGPGFGRDSRLLFDPPADGDYQARITDARGMGGVNFGYRLTVRPPREHFQISYAPKKLAVYKGGAIPVTFTAQRLDGYDGPINVKVTNLPEGFHMPPTTIEAGTFATTVALYASADAKAPPAGTKLILEGTGVTAGLPFGYVEAIDPPALIEPGDLVTTTVESEVAIKPGGQAKMTATIERRNGFKGRVPLDVKGLPHGVRVIDIGLNGILVNENETTRTFVIYAEPWVPAQDHPFVVLARREGKNTEHAAKAVVLKVK